MKRVVSLTPAATEIVHALGMGDSLVGRSHECDYPESVQALPACTHSKIDSMGGSRAIHDQVREAWAKQFANGHDGEGKGEDSDAELEARAWAAASLYELDVARLNELAPDVIVTQAQCEVCAVSLSAVEEAVGQLVASKPKVVSVSPRRLEEVWESIGAVAEALEVSEQGATLVASLRARVEAVAQRVREIADAKSDRVGDGEAGDIQTVGQAEESEENAEDVAAVKKIKKERVGCLEWLDPLMGAGNWIPQLIELAGGRAVFGEVGEHSPWLSIEDLAREDPDVIVVQPCGLDMDRAYQEMSQLTAVPGWLSLRAVRLKRVFIADGNAYFNRPGPRLVESLEVLAEILHRQEFEFGHQGLGWRLM